MFTVALIGGDGAGKTSVARYLETNLPWRVKYLYMGPSTISGNITLPTTKLARLIKMKVDNKPEENKDKDGTLESPNSDKLHYGYKKRGLIWIIARFINRILEAYWRQLFSVTYRLKGHMVLYDRHLLFDAAPRDPSKIRMKRIFNHMEYWILNHLFPKPDLVIFLDAPAEILYSRKKEASIKHLNSRREAALKQGEKTENFVRIDASLPLEHVLNEVREQIVLFEKTWNKEHGRRFFSKSSH